MLWLNLELSLLDNEAFGCADSLDWGTWLKLMRYCCVQENRGRIRAAKTWDDKKIRWVLRVEKTDLDRKSALWEWSGDDLRVHFYPLDRQREMERLRAQASKAAKIRWERSHATGHANRMPAGMPAAVRTDADRTAERKGREGKGKERKGREAAMPAGIAGTHSPVASSPPTREEVAAFIVGEGGSAELAADFHDTFTANGWTQGGRPEAPLAAWEPEARKWVRRARRDVEGGGGKKSLEGAGAAAGAVLPFNPKAPHAHTGGIPPGN